MALVLHHGLEGLVDQLAALSKPSDDSRISALENRVTLLELQNSLRHFRATAWKQARIGLEAYRALLTAAPPQVDDPLFQRAADGIRDAFTEAKALHDKLKAFGKEETAP